MILVPVLALACGAVVSLPFASIARHELVVWRTRAITIPVAPERPLPGGLGLARRPVVRSLISVLGAPRRRRRSRRADAALQRELPVVVDLVGVAVASGCTPFLALEHAARFGPPRSAAALRDVERSCALGRPLDESLRELASSAPALRGLADELRTTARLGSPVLPALARLATEVRADVRRAAEARARTVPVRLCFPLVLCVLPAFALLTVVPAVIGGLHG